MSNFCKIQSVIVSQFRIVDSVETPSGEKMPCITGKASHSEVISQKGYRYRKGFWPRVINDSVLQNKIANRDVLGMIEHPKDDYSFLHTPYEKAAVVCLRAWCEGEDPYIMLGLLNNEPGNAVKALIEVGHRPGVSTRAFGEYSKDNVSSFVKEDTYTCPESFCSQALLRIYQLLWIHTLQDSPVYPFSYLLESETSKSHHP
jgi:hypothetical protein